MFENTSDYQISGVLNKYLGASSFVEIPEGITEIAEGAFENSDVCEVVFSSTVEKIGASAFKNCEKLKRISFGASIKRFDSDAFSNCNSLEIVDYLGSVNEWLSISFGGFTANPLFYGNLYQNGEKVKEIVVDGNVGDYAFCGLSAETLKFKRSVKRIGTGAFADCKATGELALNAEEIGELAFRGTRFEEIRLGATLSKIESWAFFRCAAEKVYFEGDIKDWTNIFIRDVWANPLYNADLYVKGKKVEDLVIPMGVKEIKDAAFAGSKIKTLTLNEDVQKIGEAAFYGCESLTTIYGLSPTAFVHPDAFALCTQLNKW